MKRKIYRLEVEVKARASDINEGNVSECVRSFLEMGDVLKVKKAKLL